MTPPPATISGRSDRANQRGRVRQWPGDVPGPLAKEPGRPVERLGLHVLRQRQGDRAGLRLTGQHAHCLQRGVDQLLGPRDSVPIAGDRPEGVVDRDLLRPACLQLLKNGPDPPGGEHVTGKEEHREPVDRGSRRAGDHVGRAGADRAGAGEYLEPVGHAGVGRGRVHLRLFVA